MRILPYGTWPSPLSPEAASAARVSVGNLVVGPDGAWWWSESRPQEQGRQVVVRRAPDGALGVVSPDGVSVRTRVHEYGGAAFTVAGDQLVYVSTEDDGLWCLPAGADAGIRMSPPPPDGERHRYGEPQAVAGTDWVVAVRERHFGGGVDDELVALRRVGPSAPPVVLAAGRDFFAEPRPSPDGARLAWIAWDHPNMPWDGCELWVAPLEREAGGAPVLGSPRRVAGGPEESVGQPTWRDDGSLLFVSDRQGWWQPCLWSATGEPGAAAPEGGRRLCAEEAEFHAPDWVLGQATLAPLDGGRLACRFRREGRDRLGVVDIGTAELREVDQPCVSIAAVRALHADSVAVVGATASEPVGVLRISLAGAGAEVVHRPGPVPLPPTWVSSARLMSFPTADGHRAHLLFFPPTSPDVAGPVDAAPPLVVQCHGGPTGAAEAGFDLGVQLWTTRGYAVALVDYRGSSGYGRAYRALLQGRWGVADAEDVVTAASFLASRGLVDATRMVVRGSSAGGLTALQALRAGGPFAAALVSYGVTDLAALARDTHKFESRYVDRLVGPWPQAAARYEARSPALHPEELDGAVLLLQGEDDPVVPPDQARRMAEALRRRGKRCDLELFPGEAHGFRRAETLARAAELELSFASSVLRLSTSA